MVVCGLGKEERADQQQGGSDTRAVLDEWEMEKRAQCFEMGDGAAGMPRWSRLLQNIFVIFGCGLELLELLLVWKLLLHIHSPEPHGRDFWLTAPASRERRTLWGFPGYQPFAGTVNVGRALKFATLLPQTWCFHCSPRSDTPSPDCLGLTHSLVLVEAERGGRGGFKVAAIRLGLTRRP